MEYCVTSLAVSQLAMPAAAPAPTPLQATGGDIADIEVDGVAYRVHTFRNVGSASFTVTSLGNSNGQVEYLIVAGGGGGGGWGGGGGGGGVLTGTTTVSPQTYTVVVGAGGARGTSAYTGGGDGGNSSVFGLTAIGGGGGGWYNTNNGRPGGSGGGGGGGEANTTAFGSFGGAGTAGQGFAGGRGRNRPGGVYWGSGGGGGAAGPGEDAPDGGSSAGGRGGKGGDGLLSTINGQPLRYGAGGGGHTPNHQQSLGGRTGGGRGGTWDIQRPAENGVNGLGGGGGGAQGSGASIIGDGGSGTVIIRYPFTRQQQLQLQAPSYIASPGAPIQMLYYRTDERSQWSAPVGLAATPVLPLGLTITPKRANSLIVMTWMINGEVHWDTVWQIYLNNQLITDSRFQGTNAAPVNPGRWVGYAAGIYDAAGNVDSTGENWFIQYSIIPNSTRAMTFYPAIKSASSAAYTFNLNRCAGALGQDNYENMVSTGVIMEIVQ